MARIKNPNFPAPADDIKPREAALKTAIDTFDAGVEYLSFDDIRGLLPAAVRDKATDGRIHQFLIDNGYEVDV